MEIGGVTGGENVFHAKSLVETYRRGSLSAECLSEGREAGYMYGQNKSEGQDDA